jgi:hypothetical protein
MPAGAFCELPDFAEASGYATLFKAAACRDIPLSHCIGPLACAMAFSLPAERFMTIPQIHKRSTRMRRAETTNELPDFSLVLIITSPVGTEKSSE